MKRPASPISFAGFLIAFWLILATGAYFVVHKPAGMQTALRLALTAWDAFAAGLLLAAAGGIGRRLLPALPLRPAARAAVQAAAGLGLLSLFQLLAGAAIGVTWWFGWLSLLSLLGVFRKQALRWLQDLGDVRTILRPAGRFGRITAALISVGLALTFLRAALPPVHFDALVYHLALPQTYLETGRIGYVSDNLLWGMPQIGEVLYTWALSLTGRPETAALFGWAAGVIAAVGTLAYAAQLLGARAAWAGAAALLAGATTLDSLAWAYVDWFTLLFGLACLAVLHTTGLPNRPDRGAIAWAGALAGFAVGVKYSAGALLLAGIAALLLGDDPYAGWTVYRRRLGQALVFGSAAVVTVIPWLVKNALAFGNPLFPMLVTSSSPMNPDQLTLPPWGGWENAVLLPWQATMTGLEGAAGFSASSGPLLLALGALSWLGWKALPPDARRGLREAAVVAIVGLLVWAAAGRLSGHLIQTRLYFALFPAFAVLAGAGFRGLEGFAWPGVRLGRIAGIVCIFVLGLNALEIGTRTLVDGVPAAFLGLPGSETYEHENLGMVALAVEAVNALPPDTRILMLYEPRGLACTPRCDPDEILDRWAYDAAQYRREPAEILSAWRLAGYTHVLYFRAGADFFRTDPRYPPEDWLALNAVITALEPVVDLDQVYVLFVLP